MARRKKRHRDLVRDGSWLRRKHAHMLRTAAPVGISELDEIQRRYLDADDDVDRARAALDYQETVQRRFSEGRSSSDLSLQQAIYAACGPGWREVDHPKLELTPELEACMEDHEVLCAYTNQVDRLDADQRRDLAGHLLPLAWQRWDNEHGLRWRARRGCLGNSCLVRLDKLVDGGCDGHGPAIEAQLRQLLAAAEQRWAGLPEPPDPPGYELVPAGARSA
jgi:hypothetical protein